MFHFNYVYQTTQYRGSQLCYVASYRSLSSNYRSDVVLVDEGRKRLSFVVSEHKLLLAPTICEVRQTYLKKESESLFKLFDNKIYRASKKVQESFTIDNIFNMLLSLEYTLSNHSHTGYYKYNLQDLFCNPCFLLYCYFQLKKKKEGVDDDIPVRPCVVFMCNSNGIRDSSEVS